MPKVNARQFAEKWGRNLKGATEDIRRGIDRVTEAPGEKAAAQQDKMLRNLTARVNDGTWASRVRGVDLATWKRLTSEIGVGRVAAGVDGASSDVQSFADELLAHEAGLQDSIAGMPDVTLEDNIARASEWIRRMAEFKRS